MRPVHPKVPSEAEATIGAVMLAGHQQATTCPFDLNAWRITAPPHRLDFIEHSRRRAKNYGRNPRLFAERPHAAPIGAVTSSGRFDSARERQYP
jgi:hypothetical protein